MNTLEKSLKILEINEFIQMRELRNKFLNLAKTYHPDINLSLVAKEKFQNMLAAYEYIRDHFAEFEAYFDIEESTIHDGFDGDEFSTIRVLGEIDLIHISQNLKKKSRQEKQAWRWSTFWNRITKRG